MTSYWIWPISRENFEILRGQAYRFVDFKKPARSLELVAPGDGIAVYISKRYGGDAHIKAILEARSRVQERGPASLPVWAEERRSGHIEWPFRVDTTLVRECDVDLPSMFPAMEAPSHKEKSRPGGLGLFLQGATLKGITPGDWGIIESKGATGPRPQSPLVEEPSVERPCAAPTRRRVFGPPLNFRELRHEPINEQGVVYLFGMVARELGFLVESIATGFPDCDAKRVTRGGFYEPVKIEFEYKASNFHLHGHDPSQCDLVVCWENDWPACPIDVLELRGEIRRLQT